MDGSEARDASPAGKTRALRATASAVLATLACLLAPLALIAVWVHDIALDTDRYVETVAPLARDRVVQDAAAARIAHAVGVRTDGPAAAADLAAWLRSRGLPPRAARTVRGLGPQLDAAVTGSVEKAATRVVRSERFAQLWTRSNRVAHRAVVHALTGEGRGAVGISGGTVVLDVGAAVDTVKDQLVADGIAPAAAIPSTDRQFVLLDSDQLGKVRKSAHALDVAGNWMPAVVVVLAAAGVLLAHRRRRALARTALGVAAACLAVAIALSVARGYYLDHLPSAVHSRAAAAAVFDTLVRFLRTSLRTVVVLGVVIALGAYLVGPGRLPVAVRGGCERAADRVAGWAAGQQLGTGPVGVWTRAHRTAVTVTAVGVVAAGFAVWNRPTPLVILLLVGVLLAALAVIALLSATARPRGGDSAGP